MSSQTFYMGIARWTGRALLGLVLVGMSCVTNGCQSSSSDPEGSGGAAGLGGEGPSDGTSCDEFESEHDALLNAETDAVVVRKTPNIPKAP